MLKEIANQKISVCVSDDTEQRLFAQQCEQEGINMPQRCAEDVHQEFPVFYVIDKDITKEYVVQWYGLNDFMKIKLPSLPLKFLKEALKYAK